MQLMNTKHVNVERHWYMWVNTLKGEKEFLNKLTAKFASQQTVTNYIKEIFDLH